MIGTFVVVLDTCVLAPMPLADLLLRLAAAGLYLPRWSAETVTELCRTLENKFRCTPQQVQRRLAAMTTAFPEALIEGYQVLLPSIDNDPNDRHVVAAAVKAHARHIVTYNIRHFPAASLAPWEIEVVRPGDFLISLFDLDPELATSCLLEQAREIGRPVSELLSSFEVGVPDFLNHIRPHFAGR